MKKSNFFSEKKVVGDLYQIPLKKMTNEKQNKEMIERRVQTVMNFISNVRCKEQVRSGVNSLSTIPEKILLIDKLIKRREEIKRIEETSKMETLNPVFNLLKDKIGNKRKVNQSGTKRNSFYYLNDMNEAIKYRQVQQADNGDQRKPPIPVQKRRGSLFGAKGILSSLTGAISAKKKEREAQEALSEAAQKKTTLILPEDDISKKSSPRPESPQGADDNIRKKNLFNRKSKYVLYNNEIKRKAEKKFEKDVLSFILSSPDPETQQKLMNNDGSFNFLQTKINDKLNFFFNGTNPPSSSTSKFRTKSSGFFSTQTSPSRINTPIPTPTTPPLLLKKLNPHPSKSLLSSFKLHNPHTSIGNIKLRKLSLSSNSFSSCFPLHQRKPNLSLSLSKYHSLISLLFPLF